MLDTCALGRRVYAHDPRQTLDLHLVASAVQHTFHSDKLVKDCKAVKNAVMMPGSFPPVHISFCIAEPDQGSRRLLQKHHEVSACIPDIYPNLCSACRHHKHQVPRDW